MDLAVIIEIAAGLLTVGGTVIANLLQNSHKNELQDERLKHTENIFKTEIDGLTKKVELHNRLVDRMYEAEGDIEKNTFRIENLEKKAEK
jgi:hypothetical protein